MKEIHSDTQDTNGSLCGFGLLISVGRMEKLEERTRESEEKSKGVETTRKKKGWGEYNSQIEL